MRTRPARFSFTELIVMLRDFEMPVSPVGVCDSSSWLEIEKEFGSLTALLPEGLVEPGSPYRRGLLYSPTAYGLLQELIADQTLIFSPPKVGGSTIAATLAHHAGVYPEASHLHLLSSEGLAFVEQLIERLRSHPRIESWQGHLACSRGTRVMLAANRALRKGGLGSVVRKPYVIAGVRDPIALLLSFAFECWWLFAERPEDLNADFLHHWILNDPWCQIWQNWFTGELGAVFGVNVYAQPFPHDRGWEIYENDRARVLVIRQENLARLPVALGALYEMDPSTFTMITRNVSATKDYASPYSQATRAFRLSDSELDVFYGAPQTRHFFRPDEIERFKNRWRASSEQKSSVIDRPAPQQTGDVSSETGGGVGGNSWGVPLTEKDTQGPRCHAPSRHSASAHRWVCRLCPHCAEELARIPILEQACVERLAVIERLNAEIPMLAQACAERLALIERLAAELRAAQETIKGFQQAQNAQRPQ